jgi:serine/threonine protein kinase
LNPVAEDLIRCPACQGEIEVSSIAPGTEILCPHCNHQFAVVKHFDVYRLDRLLGEGGMGSVYQALDTRLNRTVAIKVLKAGLSSDTKFITNFLREVEITAQLNHPNIVQVFAFGEHNGQYYLVMEFIGDHTLDAEIQRRKRLPENDVISIAIGVASGLRFALEKGGLIHRDIKPGNILIGSGGIPKIVDFGLALTPETAEESSGEIWGTPYYVSPERLEGQPEDFRSDMYSLGMTLYHALVGRPAFEASTAELVAMMHVTETPMPLQTYVPSIQEPTSYAIMKSMARDPNQRFSSYTEFIGQLEDARRRLAQTAALPAQSRVRVAQPAPDSKQTLLIAGIVGAVVLLGVAGFVGWRMMSGM